MVSIIYLVFDFGRFFVYKTEKRLFAPAWAGRFCRFAGGGNVFAALSSFSLPRNRPFARSADGVSFPVLRTGAFSLTA